MGRCNYENKEQTATMEDQDQQFRYTRVLNSVKKFLKAKNYTIKHINWPDIGVALEESIPIIAYDNDNQCLAMIDMSYTYDTGFGFPDDDTSEENKKRREKLALEYLSEADVSADTRIRFDTVALVVVKSDKALIRYHMNVFG